MVADRGGTLSSAPSEGGLLLVPMTVELREGREWREEVGFLGSRVMGLRARRDEESAEEETGVLEDILFELLYYRLKYDVLFTYISDSDWKR